MSFKYFASVLLVFTVGGFINMGLFRFIDSFNVNGWLNLYVCGGITFFIAGVLATMNGGKDKKDDK